MTVFACKFSLWILPILSVLQDMLDFDSGFQDTIVAIRTAGNKLIITNVDKEKYPAATFDLDPSQVRLCIHCFLF